MINKKHIMGYMRRDIIIVLSIEVLIILCLATFLYNISKHQNEKGLLINVLGKQRMFTQKLAKDSINKQSLIQAKRLGDLIEPENIIQDKRISIQQNIISARDEFERTLDQIKNGTVIINNTVIDIKDIHGSINSELIKADKIWTRFRQSVNIILEKESIDSEFIGAVIYIGDNNLELLSYCDSITEVIVNDKSQLVFKYKWISVILVVLFFITLGISIYNQFKHLIIPLNTFIEGLGDMGMIKKEKILGATEKEVVPIMLELNKMSKKLERLISLIETINQNLSMSEELEFIFHKFASFIPYSYIGVALVKDDGKTLEAAYGIGDNTIKGLPKNMLGKRFQIDGTSLKEVIKTGDARIINDLEIYNENTNKSEYNKVILEAGIRSSITLPLIADNKPIGIIFFSSVRKNVYSEEHARFLELIAKSLAISFEKNIFVDNLLYSSILALAKLAEARDEDTGEHLEKMKIYSKTITQLLYEDSEYKKDITLNFIDDIERFSPMHDIGKVGVRDGILLKPAKLSVEEFEDMKKHTAFGGEVLRAAEENIMQSGRSMFSIGIEIAEGHHEKWDGSGYPRGKSAQDIPLSARIVAIADVLDALTSKRPYKKAFTFEESFNYIIEGSGNHFDPEIVRVVVLNKERIFKLYSSFQKGAQL